MSLNVSALARWTFPPVSQEYSERDSILYALSVGFGATPNEPGTFDLDFVYEKRLKIVPTMASVLCHPGVWLHNPDFRVTLARVVHGEQRMTFHRPLLPTGKVIGMTEVVGVEDKGSEKGAVIHVQRTIVDRDTGAPYASIIHSTFCRADGGFSECWGRSFPTHEIPERPPDLTIALQTRPDAALLYRLNADRNPLHVDPERARQAGFARPILHGLCLYGVAARGILQTILEGIPQRLASFDVRFAGVFYPGETLELDLWRDSDVISFVGRSAQRQAIVLNNGRAMMKSLS